jgi:hypothetical protein
VALRRQTVLGLTIGAVLLVAIGGLGMVHFSRIDPDAVKKELDGRIAELQRIPDSESVRKDKLVEELLAVELYKEHAKAAWLKLDRAHRSLHEAAQLERGSEKAVKDFLARSRAPGADPYTLEAEARSLIGLYGFTRWGDALRGEQRRLQVIVDANRGPQSADVLALTRDVQKALKDGKPDEALRAIADFEKRFPSHQEYDGKLAELRDQVKRKVDQGRRDLKKP